MADFDPSGIRNPLRDDNGETHSAVEGTLAKHDMALNIWIKHLPWKQPRQRLRTGIRCQQAVEICPKNSNRNCVKIQNRSKRTYCIYRVHRQQTHYDETATEMTWPAILYFVLISVCLLMANKWMMMIFLHETFHGYSRNLRPCVVQILWNW